MTEQQEIKRQTTRSTPEPKRIANRLTYKSPAIRVSRVFSSVSGTMYSRSESLNVDMTDQVMG